VMFHMRDPELCNQVYSEVIQPYLADTEKTRILQHDGTYVRENSAHAPANAREPFTFNVQEFLIGFAEGREAISEVPHAPATIKFPPMRPVANVPERKKTKGAKVRVAPAPPPSETAVPKA
jgi:hypothetical protein